MFDATMKVTALKQTSHDMIAHMGKARAIVEELKRFLVADSLKEVNRKLDKFYMVLRGAYTQILIMCVIKFLLETKFRQWTLSSLNFFVCLMY